MAETSTMSYAESCMGISPSPGSPPGMTASKSSKSSSFKSLNSDDGSVLADVSHFEDIGLDEPAIYPEQPAPSRKMSISTSPKLKARHLGQARQLSIQKTRPALSVQTDHRPRMLPIAVSHAPKKRSLSPNPHANSVTVAVAAPVGSLKPRRGSWQSVKERKTAVDLEKECEEDDGDDIPDDLILDNVPISPRPPQDRSASSPLPSPRFSRSPKEKEGAKKGKPRERTPKPAGNGTPAVPSSANSGTLRTPTWKSDTNVPTVKSLPPSPIKVRAKSWNAALSDLNAEAKALTEKLEEHADEELKKKPVMNRRSLDSHSPTNSSKNGSPGGGGSGPDPRTRPLLLLQQTNMMIDPLPVSKEKQAVLSRTRPSWLPPKDPAEEKRHLREYQKMMAHSLEMDKRRDADKKTRTVNRDATADSRKLIWEEDVLPRWNDAIRERRTRDLWWKGVVPRCRSAVWSRAIGNDLGLTETSFKAALKRAAEMESRVAAGNGTADDARRANWCAAIRSDVQDRTWPDIKIFQSGGPLHQSLVDVLCAYAMYRSDIGYVSGCNTIAALLLLNLSTGVSAFIALANILNRPLPLSFYASDPGAKSSAYNLLLQTLSIKSPSLHAHLKAVCPDLDMYLSDIFSGLFTAHLALDEAARLWDIYVFEGDSALVRAGVAILMAREMDLLAASNPDEVTKVLEPNGCTTTSVLGDIGEEKWVGVLKEAGKS